MAKPPLVVFRPKVKIAHGVDALEDEVFELYEVCSGHSISLYVEGISMLTKGRM